MTLFTAGWVRVRKDGFYSMMILLSKLLLNRGDQTGTKLNQYPASNLAKLYEIVAAVSRYFCGW